MKRPFSPLFSAAWLILGSIVFRLLSSLFPEAVPNISPLMAVAFVGAIYLPLRWGWLVGSVSLLVTDLAFLPLNYRTDGSMFSAWTLVSLAVYALAGVMGLMVARRPSLGKIAAGSVACSLLFYFAANTFSWWHNLAAPLPGMPVYASSFAGWWQANTTGLPGYVPTWTFLRNAVAGDLLFAFVLVFAFDRGLLWGRAAAISAARAA